MKSFHGKVSSVYLARVEAIFSPLKQLSYEKMRVSENGMVLDVGCGPGADVINLAKRVRPDGHAVGLDHDGAMLKEALLTVEKDPEIRNVSFNQGRASALPFRDDVFDGCRSERLFMHLAEPERVLSEMVRVTRPGGRVVVIDTDWNSLSIDTPLPRIEQLLSNYRIQHVLNNGYSGRSLYRQFRERKLSDIEVDVFPVYLTDVRLFYFIAMQQAIEDQALADQAVTRKELDEWRLALSDAEQNECFFCTANVIMLSASKPGISGNENI